MQAYLERHKIPVIWDLDTRALVRHLRSAGALRGIVATDGTPAEKLIAEACALPTMAGQELASRVTSAERYDWHKGSIELAVSPWRQDSGEANSESGTQRWRVVAYDFGIKQNILRKLRGEGCKVTVVPAQTPAEDVLALKPDGIMVSQFNGSAAGQTVYHLHVHIIPRWRDVPLGRHASAAMADVTELATLARQIADRLEP